MILALDLGTKTGFAAGNGKTTMSGSWNLKTDRHEGGGMKFLRFKDLLRKLDAEHGGLDAVYFEEVRRHVGTGAAHVYGGMKATLEVWCEDGQVPYSSVPVGTIKAFWTGKGNASKEAMIAVAREKGFEPVDDNEADALAILHWALEHGARVPA